MCQYPDECSPQSDRCAYELRNGDPDHDHMRCTDQHNLRLVLHSNITNHLSVCIKWYIPSMRDLHSSNNFICVITRQFLLPLEHQPALNRAYLPAYDLRRSTRSRCSSIYHRAVRQNTQISLNSSIAGTIKSHNLYSSFQSDDMLLQQSATSNCCGCLVSTIPMPSGRSKGLKDIRGRTLQADGVPA